MIRSELRATVSSGFRRPPTSTGILPNFVRSRSPFAVLGGNQLTAIHAAATTKMTHGKKRFMRWRSFVAVQTRRDENQIAQAILPRRSRTQHRARGSSGCAPLAKSSRNRLFESPLDRTFHLDNATDDSYKLTRPDSPNAPGRSTLRGWKNSSESPSRRIYRV